MVARNANALLNSNLQPSNSELDNRTGCRSAHIPQACQFQVRTAELVAELAAAIEGRWGLQL